MGWDSIIHEGHSELFNDFDLWTLRHFLMEEVKALEVEDAGTGTTQLREFFEKWEWLGPGVVTGTDFSDYVSGSRSRWNLLLVLLQRTGDRIAGFGEFIPLGYLTTHVDSGLGHYLGPSPTTRHLNDLGRMCKLLGKHEPQEG